MVGYQKHSVRFIWLVNLGLLVGLGYFARVWLLSEQQSPMIDATATQPANHTSTPQPLTNDINEIPADLNIGTALFGKHVEVKPPEKPSLLSKKPERPILPKKFPLNVKLLGTVAGSPATSFAVLEDLDAKQQDIFKVGDMIQKARVETILQNRIVVAYEGQLWPLDVGLSEGRNTTQSRQVASVTKAPQEGHVKDILMAMSDSEILVNSLASNNAIRAVSQAAKGLSFTASRGAEDGIKLSGISKSPLGRLIGLQEGDLIRSVNGRAVNNKRKAAQVLRKARKLGQAEFGLVRNHQEKTLSFKPGLW